MLQAKSSTGTLITLAKFTPKEIAVLKRKKQFFCPTCKEQVIAKAGKKMIPHFAHRSKVNCPSYEGGEGAYHEKGKLLLYQWLQKQNLQVKLEHYLPDIKQQPDLFLVINDKKIAIEFQCARVAIAEIHKRNKGYIEVGITPIWILGANRFKRQAQNHLKVDQFTKGFMHQFSTTYPLNLYYFCPHTLQFTTFQHIYLIGNGIAIGNFYFKPINQLHFTDIFIQHPFSKAELYVLWKREKRKFRMRHRKLLHGKERKWHQWLYLKRTHIEYLPSIVFLPVSGQYKMNSPPWNWQSRLCIDMLHPLQIGSHFSLKTCEHLLRNHIHHQNDFPLIKSTQNPIIEYLHLLVQLKIIKRQSPNMYIKINPITFYKTIEESLQGDDISIRDLIKIPINKIQA